MQAAKPFITKPVEGKPKKGAVIAYGGDLVNAKKPRPAEKSQTCFVIMPFTKKFHDVYRLAIRPSISSTGLRPFRAYESMEHGPILSGIWKAIRDARLVIADISGRNPNIFYELGVAHALGKEIVLLYQETESIPFDVAHFRLIRYKPHREGLSSLKSKLSKALRLELAEESQPRIVCSRVGLIGSGSFGVAQQFDRNSAKTRLAFLLEKADNAKRNLRFEESIRFLQEVLKLRQLIGDISGQARTLNNLGSLHQQLGNYEKAITNYQKALELLKEVGDFEGEAASYNNLGNALQITGDFFRAEHFYKRAMEVSKREGTWDILAKTKNNLADLYQQSDRLEEAEQQYKSALETFARLNDVDSIARVNSNLATLMIRNGELAKAEALILKSLEHLRKKDELARSRFLHNLGYIKSLQQNYEEAVQYLRESIGVKQRLRDKGGEAASFAVLAQTSRLQGNLSEAIELLRHALAIQENIGDQVGLMHTLQTLSSTLADVGEMKKSEEILRAALSISEEIGAPEQVKMAKTLQALRMNLQLSNDQRK